jgi:hypothetical protein
MQLFIIFLPAVGAVAMRRVGTAAMSSLMPSRRVTRVVRLVLGGHGLKTVMETMIDDMFGSVLPSITKSYLPNVVTFGLHPQDVRRWGACFDQLAAELAGLIMAQLDRRPDLELAGHLEVRLVEDETAGAGRPTFAAQTGGEPAETTWIQTEIATRPMRASGTDLPDELPASCWGLEVLDGDRVRFVELTSELVVGRGREAMVRLAQRGVSRLHARFTLLDGEVSVVDLESSNGTFLNGQRITMAMLDAGDRIRFGSHAEAELVCVDQGA